MARSVELWVGKDDDAVAPPRVRARVFDRCEGRCHKCGRLIGPADHWTLEHLIALINGGKNAEANMCLTCHWCLPMKNAEDAAIKSHGTQVRYRHLGIETAHPKLRSAGFRPAEPQRTATRPLVRKSERQPHRSR